MKNQRFLWTKFRKKVCLSCGKVYYVRYNQFNLPYYSCCMLQCAIPLSRLTGLIYLEANKENIVNLLKNVVKGTSPFTHQQISAWCRYKSNVTLPDKLFWILWDIDSKWRMYLTTNYTMKELQQLDFSKVNLPIEWFENWLKLINLNDSKDVVMTKNDFENLRMNMS